VGGSGGTKTTDILYLPAYTVSTSKLLGRVVQASPPGWWSGAQQAAAGGADKFNAVQGNSVAGSEPTAGQAVTDEICRVFNDTLYGIAAQTFLATLKSGVEARLTMPLMIKSAFSLLPGQYVIPGTVVSVTGDSEGNEVLFNMYTRSVVHTIDMGACTATTEVIGAYCRKNGGYTNIATDGTYNPIYSA